MTGQGTASMAELLARAADLLRKTKTVDFNTALAHLDAAKSRGLRGSV